MNAEPYNIMITGVGGQGNLVTSGVLARAAILDGFSPTIGQTFGASQRGGAVVTHLRLADEQTAPLIPRGHLDTLIGLEPLEGLRAAVDFAGPRTIAVVSDLRIDTLDTLAGDIRYPDLRDIFAALSDLCKTVYMAPAVEDKIMISSLNAYLVGLVVGLKILPISQDSIRRSYETLERHTENNLRAFASGLEDASNLRPLSK